MTARAILLYRSILKAHRRSLPLELSQIGDSFVRNEFKLHKNASPEQAIKFFQEWEGYLETLKSEGLGAGLGDSDVAQMTEEQKSKLNELKDEIFKS